MVSLVSDYDEALDVIHTIRADSGQQVKGDGQLSKQGMVSPSSYYSEVLIAMHTIKGIVPN